ncbi:MAG TPA: sugar ABC transporter substrate-binding protein [Candidatus Limnocylindrales bacterium]|jgi:simple sugar transport system substrate-binding protein|nr:sugar ABC transporter substrate-binding protein [Candidatus Limnocylindrales bacterium]
MAATVAANGTQRFLGPAHRAETIGTAALAAAHRRRQNGMDLRSKTLVALAGAAIFVGACTSGTPTASGGGAAGPDRSGINIQVVTHGQASDPFWSIFKNGVDQAAKDMGVKVEYAAPDTFDMPKMAQLIDAAVAKKPAGLVVSIPDATALGPSIQKAVAAGIPVISANSGSDVFASLGVLTHVGQDESIAGKKAGELLKAAGVTNALCINQEVGNAALDARCAGFEEGLAGTSKVVQVDLKDPTGAQQTIAAAVQADSTLNGVLALGPTGSAPTLAAIKQLNLGGKVKLATFDLSKDVLNAIKAGEMEFAIDQQQFLQGYLPVVFLTYDNLYGLVPGGGQPVLTGPGIVDKTNVDTVIANTGTTR